MGHSFEKHPANTGHHAGILIPLFSMRSRSDWGIGDFSAMLPWLDWTAQTGTKILQILPIHELPPQQDCPYTALTAFALDPVYISLAELADAADSPRAREFLESRECAAAIEKCRKSPSVMYCDVKALKFKALWLAFEYFYEEHWLKKSPRAAALRQYRRDNAYWLYDYSVFRTLKDLNQWRSWTEWPEEFRSRNPQAICDFRAEHEKEVLFFEYMQWVAALQWQEVKKRAAGHKLWLFGDLPFMVNQESADAWANQDVFDIAHEIGAPPDQFSTEGQMWGLPAYNWGNLEASGFSWWRLRLRRAREIYELLRLDHLVGFFRTWICYKDKSRPAGFDVKDEQLQQQRGERFLRMVIEESGHSMAVAEDLGLIPDFVRETLKRLNIPGYKVMRWEKDKVYYRDPENYPQVSLATTSTHDTETLREWWETVPAEEKSVFWRMVSGEEGKHPRYSDKVNEAVLRRILGSASSMVLVPVQDIFGFSERINTPGTVGGHNWSYRFPVEIEKLSANAKLREKAELYSQIVRETGRLIA